MSYDFSIAGRLAEDASGPGSILTFEDVQGLLVEAVRLQWRSEPGCWPFASDGPWHLIRREDLAGYDGGRSPTRMPKLPLTREEVAKVERAMRWLAGVGADGDRKLIVLAVTELAKGAAQVPWRRLLAPMGKARGADGLRMRYGRALSALTKRVNREPLAGAAA